MKGIAACFWAVAWQDQLLGRRPEESDNEKGSRLPEALIAIVEATYAELVILWG